MNTRVKGLLLTAYYQVRNIGSIRHETKSRLRWYFNLGVFFEGADAFGERLINSIMKHDLLIRSPEVADEWIQRAPADLHAVVAESRARR